MDHTGNGGGSLHITDNLANGDQCVDIGWMDGAAWSGTTYDLTGWTNISFYVKWDAAEFHKRKLAPTTAGPGETPQFWG